MSKPPTVIVSPHTTDRGTPRGYVIGFVSSIILTITAYLLVVNKSLSHSVLIGAVVILALAQFVVQVVFFLHLGRETRPRWKLAVFLFMSMVVLILVFGSLWIMNNLNYRMTPEQMQNYMNNQAGL